MGFGHEIRPWDSVVRFGYAIRSREWTRLIADIDAAANR